MTYNKVAFGLEHLLKSSINESLEIIDFQLNDQLALIEFFNKNRFEKALKILIHSDRLLPSNKVLFDGISDVMFTNSINFCFFLLPFDDYMDLLSEKCYLFLRKCIQTDYSVFNNVEFEIQDYEIVYQYIIKKIAKAEPVGFEYIKLILDLKLPVNIQEIIKLNFVYQELIFMNEKKIITSEDSSIQFNNYFHSVLNNLLDLTNTDHAEHSLEAEPLQVTDVATKEIVLELIGDGELNSALQYLYQMSNNDLHKYKEEIMQLRKKYIDLEKDYYSGLIRNNKYSIRRAQIVKSMIHILNEK